ncbi:hypothetical protein BJI49_11940 [Acetobacter pasteurianus]|uniref:hypothetical protein n=1 Tax=Acetobacter pasteurianus TaxID=438 RepID=UPI0005523BB5|nr:hypothetical protein [Acetobacter pasteurianus]RCL04903.1 hypothetical protein BJI49_11940 [Acetobacter pasteurianus]
MEERMLKFSDLDEYLEYYKEHQGPALIPIETAAYYRDVVKETAKRMIADGRFEGVEIEGDLFVTVDSYMKLKQIDEDRESKIRSVLEDYARRGEVVTYAPIMDILGLNHKMSSDRKIIGKILGSISEKTYNEHEIFLTAIVHRKYGNKTKPGKGFFELVKIVTGQELEGDEIEETEKETRKVFDFYKTSRKPARKS